MITDAYDPRGESHIKGTGRSSEISKEPLRGAKILFCSRGLECFSSLRGTNFNTTHYLLSYIFQLNTPKGTAKISTVELLRLINLRGTKTAFLAPESYDEHPCPFYMEVPPPHPPRVYDMYSV